MTDEKPDGGRECVACDIIWNVLVIGTAVVFGLIALDYMTGGKVTDALSEAFQKVRPTLAAVIPLREAEEPGSDAAG